jgi:tetratricopeptide (TPR) repeat protein
MEEGKSLKYLTKHLENLLKLLAGAVGASSLGATIIYAMGFVVVNTSLLRYGAYEHSLLRTEFLAAGISYAVLTLGMILLGAVAVDWVVRIVEPGLKWKPLSRLLATSKVLHRTASLLAIFLAGAVFLLVLRQVARLFSAGLQWWAGFGRALIWGYMVALVGGIYVEYLERKGFWQKLATPAPALPDIWKPLLWGIGLLLAALVSYGGYAYPLLPKSWGGGSPIYVEFVVEEEAIPMLETLGLGVGDRGLTERVVFLTECPERIFVVTQRGDTVSFDPSLVKASKFYDVRYYVSADAHLRRGDWYREHKQWSSAIAEYNAALLIEASLVDARIGRGMVRTEKYVESRRKESPDDQVYRSADGDFSEAIRQAEETGDDQRAALAYYQLARLYFYADKRLQASGCVSEAVGLDASFLKVAMLEKDFEGWMREKEDDSLRRAVNDSDAWIAEQYAWLGHEREEGGELEPAVALYELAAHLAEHCAEDGLSAAQYRAYKGDALEILSLVEEAIEAYEQAVRLDPDEAEYHYRLALLSYKYGRLEDVDGEFAEAVRLNPNMTHYRYQFALLSYEHDRPEEAESECRALIDQATEADLVTVGCRIVLGNVCRDGEERVAAKGYYADAAGQAAVVLGAPSLAANAYYQWARLEAREGFAEEATRLLEKAAWLDQAYSEKAEQEGDFDVLRELADYRRAVSPPVVVEIGSDADEGSVTFRLDEPRDDFPARVSVLTQVLGLADLVAPDGTGQAECLASDEEPGLYVCRLRRDASYSPTELAGALRGLLGLAE